MAVTYGFYNSVAGDRVYDAVDMSRIFDGVILDGIFQSQGTAMVVRPDTGMNIIVGEGRAWFNHTWTLNDTDLVFTLNAASVMSPRIDAVVLEINADDAVRANSIKVITGVAQTGPVAPVPVHTALVNQYVLALISVPASLTTVTGAHITNKVGTLETPFVTGVLQGMNIDALIAQWGFQWTEWTTDQEADFTAWFQNLVNQLSTNQATNLQNQIDIINAAVNVKVIARQGGHVVDWGATGTTNYVPVPKAAMQVGNAVVLGTAGLMTVTFPLPFTGKPLVFLCQDGAVFPNNTPITGRIKTISTTGFVAEFTKHLTVSPYHELAGQLTSSNWMAIGPIA